MFCDTTLFLVLPSYLPAALFWFEMKLLTRYELFGIGLLLSDSSALFMFLIL